MRHFHGTGLALITRVGPYWDRHKIGFIVTNAKASKGVLMNKLILTATLVTFAGSLVQAQSKQTATTATTQPAAQTSTTTIAPEAQATAGKSWSLSFITQAEIAAAEANYQNSKSVNTLNSVGGSYNLSKDRRIGLRQYFSVAHDGQSGENATTMMDAAVTYGLSNLKGVFGTDPLAPTFYYVVPTSQSSIDARSNGAVRMDAEFAWTLNPKWTVSYNVSPRQSFVPNGSMLVEGREVPLFAKTTLIHYAALYYSLGDFAQAYTTGGLLHRWKTSDMSTNERNLLLAAGMNFAFIGGKIMLTPVVSVESKQIASAASLPTEEVLQEKNISYALTGAFVF